jgi:hypothetical protein
MNSAFSIQCMLLILDLLYSYVIYCMSSYIYSTLVNSTIGNPLLLISAMEAAIGAPMARRRWRTGPATTYPTLPYPTLLPGSFSVRGHVDSRLALSYTTPSRQSSLMAEAGASNTNATRTNADAAGRRWAAPTHSPDATSRRTTRRAVEPAAGGGAAPCGCTRLGVTVTVIFSTYSARELKFQSFSVFQFFSENCNATPEHGGDFAYMRYTLL